MLNWMGKARFCLAIKTCILPGLSCLALIVPTLDSLTYAQSKTVPGTGVGNEGSDSPRWESDYNLFKLRGRSDAEIAAKLSDAYNNFIGASGSGAQLVYPFQGDSSMAYVRAPADGGDYDSTTGTSRNWERAITEGQGYGMMIAAQRNDQTTFDKLWRFTKRYLQYNTASPGSPGRSYFTYRVYINGSQLDYGLNRPTISPYNDSPAPDGDLWIAASLLVAKARRASGTWSDTGLDYAADVNDILDNMLHYEERNGSTNPLTNLFNSYNEVAFLPTTYQGNSDRPWNQITDPSYHLPAFLTYFSKLGPAADAATWANLAATARGSYLPNATGQSSNSRVNYNTGLAPNYSDSDGYPYDWSYSVGFGPRSSSDAERVPSNIGVDYMWWSDGSSTYDFHRNYGNKILAYFGRDVSDSGVTNYNENNLPNGTKQRYDNGQYVNDSSANYHGAGIRAMNAVAAQIATYDKAWFFVDDLWNVAQPTDYYNGCLYMLGLLEASGNFRPYGVGSGTVTTPPDGGTSSLLTNAGFEAGTGQSPTGWQETDDADSSYVEASTDSHGGANQLVHYSSSDYSVYTYQVANVQNGTYSVRVWFRGGGSFDASGMTVKQYDSADASASQWSDFRSVITGTYQQSAPITVTVTSGKIEIGFYTKGSAGSYVTIDDVQLVKQ